MKVIGIYNKSIWLTIFSIALSVCSITVDFELKYKIIVLIIVGICDLFDGVIARKTKRTQQEKNFGIQLDTLADTINFGIYPIIIYIEATSTNIVSIIISIIYIFCIVQRLAFFNITAEEQKTHFRGLPSTYSALVITCMYIIVQILSMHNIYIFNNALYSAVYLILSYFYIFDFKIKKPHGKAYIAFVILALLVIIGVLTL